MTTKLTIKDLNCGNCPNDQECPTYDDIKVPPDAQRRRRWERSQVTGKVGCASHPLALQVLAGPVIEELEKRNARSKKMNVGELCAGVREGRSEAIKLLKEGVKNHDQIQETSD